VGCDRGKLTLTNQRGHTMTGQSQEIPPALLVAIQTILDTTEPPTKFNYYSDRIPQHKTIYGLAPIGAILKDKPQVPVKQPTKWTELIYIQCAMESLTDDGEAAVILPNGFLFRGGITENIRNNLFRDFNIHTVLRLPFGVFSHVGIKTDVLFFNKKPADGGTWFYRQYQMREGHPFMQPDHLADFVKFVKHPDSRNSPLASHLSRESMLRYTEIGLDQRLTPEFGVFY
jgi:hypothetical protein